MFCQQLRYYRKMKGLTQEQLATAIGTAKSTVSMYESGKREPDFETMEAIADTLNVSLGLLIDGESKTHPGTAIPVLGFVKAGKPIDAVEDILGYESYAYAPEDGEEYFALRITGDSMEPRMHSGDTVIVRRQSDVDSGQIAVVLVNGNDATVKKLVKTQNGIALVALNSYYEPMFFSNREIQQLPVTVIGRVVELRSRM